MNIVLLGAPGAGKGTQAIRLSKDLNLAHISTGDLLREALKSNSPIAMKAKGFMDSGKLVPDELVAEFLKDHINKLDIKKGFILDGYPRNLNQAKELDNLLADIKRGIDYVFYLEAGESVLIQRLSGRRVCSKCGANFHIKNMPPKIEGKCDICGSTLFQRNDDTPQTIKNRLTVYKEQTHSLIDYYKGKKILYKFVADQEADFVLKKILEFLNHDPHKN